MEQNYRIYNCKDGRTRVYLKNTKKVISYPKFLIEQKIGRPLMSNEQIHHIDGNPLNNDLDNLEIKFLGDHQREHSTKYHDEMVKCAWCVKTFIWTGKQQSCHYANMKRKSRIDKSMNDPFCSKKCSGEYGRFIQRAKKECGYGEIGSTHRT